MKKIGIVDFGLGNLFSVQHALTKVGGNTQLVSSPKEIAEMDALVLPGVGAFGEAMEQLQERNLVQSLREWTKEGKPLLGVCLGLQLLMERSEEFGDHEGLGIISGKVRKFPSSLNGKSIRVPQMGWNNIQYSQPHHPALEGLDSKSEMYFVHSYYVELSDKHAELTWTEYEGIRYTSSIAVSNVWAFQFHPEKSAHGGIRIYQNWVQRFA